MKYDELIERLSKLPTMDSAFVCDGDEPALREGKAIEAKLIKFTADNVKSAEERMVHEIMSLIQGREEVWVRIMPEIKIRVHEDTGNAFVTGYARIAVA